MDSSKGEPTGNGAETLVRSLIASGVDTCFSNPGTSEMHFVAALDRIPGMRSVLALFEGVATGAADGYFRMARKPACTLLHLGPGLANGLANLHNSRKAGSGVINIVGEHAETHRALDAPLMSDIAGLARPVSHWVHMSDTAQTVGEDAARAVCAARTAPGQVATLILPSDTAWTPGGPVCTAPPPASPARISSDRIDAAAALLTGPDCLLLLGAGALSEGNLNAAGRIAAATGCGLLAEWANARMERGAGRVAVGKVPYPIDQAIETLSGYRRIVLVGARAPIGFFAYPGKPATLTRPGAEICDLAGAGDDITAALDDLVTAVNARDLPAAGIARAMDISLPTGPLLPDGIAAVLARAIPENGIVVDESITTGRAFFPASVGARPHSWLNNCGGSIGYGLPVATGAAIACPDRRVLALIGDGSAMYTVQALWTMAREGLDVTAVIFANRSYQILRGELANVGAGNPGPRALDMLSLDRPALDWVSLAGSMGVPARRVEDCGAFAEALDAGLSGSGPTLVELVM